MSNSLVLTVLIVICAFSIANLIDLILYRKSRHLLIEYMQETGKSLDLQLEALDALEKEVADLRNRLNELENYLDK